VTRRGLLARLDRPRIEAAIAQAERATTGEIRVSIAGLFWGGSRRLAERAFARLGMHRTAARNGVLLLVVPWRRQLVVLGDEGIDRKVPPGFWDGVVASAAEALRAGQFTEGLCAAVEAVGRALAQHFPANADRPNPDELSNLVDPGKG
jgi:uncharacterized membrane protein